MPVVEDVTDAGVRSSIMALRSFGKSSFATLTDNRENSRQVGGGGITCMLERRDAASGRHYRGHHGLPSKVFADGTTLVFGGGTIPLAADEGLPPR